MWVRVHIGVMYKDRESDGKSVNNSMLGDLEDRASMAVVMAVGDAAGVSPRDLNPPLYEVIDPDALDTLFQGATGSVTFEYHGAVVSVDHTNTVTLAATDGGDENRIGGDPDDGDPDAEAV